MSNAIPRHVCPACEGSARATCDECLGTGARLCDSCTPPNRARAVASVDGTALCLPCLLAGLVEDEAEARQAADAWRSAHRSPTAYQSQKRDAYERMQLLARQLAETRGALHAALMGGAANDTTRPPPPPVAPALEWSSYELRVGIALYLGQIARTEAGFRIRWTQARVLRTADGDTWLAAVEAARALSRTISRREDVVDCDAPDTEIFSRDELVARLGQ